MKKEYQVNISVTTKVKSKEEFENLMNELNSAIQSKDVFSFSIQATEAVDMTSIDF